MWRKARPAPCASLQAFCFIAQPSVGYRTAAFGFPASDRFLRGGGRKKWKGGVYLPKDKLFDNTPDIRDLTDPNTGWKQLAKR